MSGTSQEMIKIKGLTLQTQRPEVEPTSSRQSHASDHAEEKTADQMPGMAPKTLQPTLSFKEGKTQALEHFRSREAALEEEKPQYRCSCIRGSTILNSMKKLF